MFIPRSPICPCAWTSVSPVCLVSHIIQTLSNTLTVFTRLYCRIAANPTTEVFSCPSASPSVSCHPQREPSAYRPDARWAAAPHQRGLVKVNCKSGRKFAIFFPKDKPHGRYDSWRFARAHITACSTKHTLTLTHTCIHTNVKITQSAQCLRSAPRTTLSARLGNKSAVYLQLVTETIPGWLPPFITGYPLLPMALQGTSGDPPVLPPTQLAAKRLHFPLPSIYLTVSAATST